MYNEKCKNQFLLSTSDDKATFVLNVVTTQFEELLGKDLAQFSKTEALSMLAHTGYFNTQTLRTIIRVSKEYCRWCIERKVFNTVYNPFDHIQITDIDLSETVRHKLISSPEKYAEIVRSVHDPHDAYMDTPVMCFLWLGIRYQDMLSIRSDDMHPESRSLFVPSLNQTYRHIPQEITDILQTYRDTKVSSRFSGKSNYPVYEDDIGMFIKRMLPQRSVLRGAPIGYRNLSQSFHIFNEAYGASIGAPFPLDQDSIARSGMYWQLYVMEKSGVNLSENKHLPVISQILGTKQPGMIKDMLWIYRLYQQLLHPEI